MNIEVHTRPNPTSFSYQKGVSKQKTPSLNQATKQATMTNMEPPTDGAEMSNCLICFLPREASEEAPPQHVNICRAGCLKASGIFGLMVLCLQAEPWHAALQL